MTESTRENTNTMQPKPTIRSIADALRSSQNVCDQRKGNCIRRVLDLQNGIWRDRFQTLACAEGEGRSLVLVCQLQVPGLVWQEGQPRPNEKWIVAAGLANNYPMAMPKVQFHQFLPFNPHVVSRSHVSDAAGMPPELQEFLRHGADGACCYLKTEQWSANASLGLPFVFWQLSRLLVFENTHGERASLNPVARDWAIRHESELPLGKPLPWPSPQEPAPAMTESEDMEWIANE